MSPRDALLRRGWWLAVATVLWNVVEGVIAVAAGTVSGSVALVAFGIDSFIETASGVVVGWRLRAELGGGSEETAERVEGIAAPVAGALLLVLAAYIAIDAGRRLLGFGAEARPSFVGLALTVVSLVVMPLLAWAKLRVAAGLESRAVRADAYETITCAWLSLTTLAGLAANAAFGWWWADPLAALGLLPLIVREGLEGVIPERS